MNIEKHISDLLYRNDCVIIPNFGAFIGDWQSASIDEVNNQLNPPKKQISFNSKIKNNDGLLVNHLASQENISYTEAFLKIEQIVSQWQDRLSKGETLQLDKIGFLSLNSDQNIIFVPTHNVNYLKDSFGLSSYYSKPVSREIEVKKEIEKEIEKIKEIEVEEPIYETDKVIHLKKKNNTVLKYTAIAALFSTIGTTVYKFYNDYQVDQQTLVIQEKVTKKIQEQLQEATFVLPNPITIVDLSQKLAPDTIQKIQDSMKIVDENKSTTENTNKKVTEESSLENRFPYHVIGAAFQSKSNAQKSVQEFIRRGFANAHILPKNKSGLYPVVYGSFKTRSEADSLIQKIKTEENSEVWLHF